ncbi:MAG: tetratricopeptide repeat protein [Acidobacteriia bacterium]|nr:tetratricopeptide repeat protein [Terriglobia bacterium]
MRIELHSARRKLLFGALCLGLIAGYVYRAGRSYLVSRAADSTDPEVLERAVRLEPGNAQAWYRLGRVRSVFMQDVPGSIPLLQRALSLDPHHARYWLDLGLAYQYTGDAAAQRNAIHQAVRYDAHDPDIAWEAGNFYLVAGDTDRALSLFHNALEGDTTGKNLARAVLLSLRATNNDFVRVVDQVLPRNPYYCLQFAELLTDARQYQAADMVWSRAVGLGKHIPIRFAANYLASLVERNNSARARSAWNDLAKLDPELQPYAYSADNLIVNGRFEHNILNVGFDWHYTVSENVTLEVDNSTIHGGTHALLITFNGQPVSDLGLRQTVPVDGDECYEFSAFLRTSELDSVGGPRFSLQDVKTAHAYVLTEDMTGTHGWEERRQTFRTEPGTHFLELKIVRNKPDTAIRGRAWTDDLRLTRAAPEACR